MNYIITARNIKRDKTFGSEPGRARFLRVPDNSLPSPEYAVPNRPTYIRKWAKEVMDKSMPSNKPNRLHGDILIFIHGYNNSQKIVIKRHEMLKHNLAEAGFNGTVVSFDWPSNDKTLNYLEDRSDAKQTALCLVDDCITLFSQMQTPECTVNVHLLAHSTGAYVIRQAFDDADDRRAIAETNWTVSQLIFIGGDVSSSGMRQGNPKSSSVYRHCIRFTNYSNPYDSALKLSNIKRVGTAPRVGRVGLPHTVPENAVNVDCGEYYLSLKQEDSASDAGDSHSWYFGDKVFIKDLLYTIEGDIVRDRIPTRIVENGRLFLRA